MMAEREWIRPLGKTGLAVSGVIVGGGPLGSMPENFGYEVAESDAVELVRRVLESPIRAIDTANGYSAGASESRIGAGIALAGGLPADFLITTKVDADGDDYSAARVRASVRESKERLGLDTLPVVFLHDPEFHDFDATLGAVEALVELHESGEVGHIGLAGGDVRVMTRYVDLGVFEVVLVHNRWTLVDRSAGDLIAQSLETGAAVVNAAIYGGGILASGTGETYGYRPLRDDTRRAIRSIQDVCARHGIDLATAALAGSYRDPRVTATIVGISKPERIDGIMAAVATELPDDFWTELETLVPARSNWLDFP